jgi:stearoyl-CoA desaturase (delta-9 desaturase)
MAHERRSHGFVSDRWLRWIDTLPYWSVHLVAVAGLIDGWAGRGPASAIAGGSYAVRLFAITAGYHRYFSHRTPTRPAASFQLVLALLGLTSTQKGPLWWAAHHRNHHKYSDQPERPALAAAARLLVVAHVLDPRRATPPAPTTTGEGPGRYPELRFVDRYAIWFTVAYAPRCT